MVCVAVIDDDREFTELVRTLLADRGWTVVACDTSDGAVMCVQQGRPDLILLDLRMETPDAGWSVLRSLARDPATGSIPVIVCSAAVDDVHAHEEWLQEHGVGVLLKPFDIDELYAALDQRLHTSVVISTESS